MINIDKDIEKLLFDSSIYDSLTPLIPYCENDLVFSEFIELICDQYNTEKILIGYYTMAHLIRCHPSDEYEKTFTPSALQESFRRFIVSWDRLSFKRVPFKEWSGLAKEGINLLKLLMSENKLEQFKEDFRYKDFMKRFIERHEDLRKTGKYSDLNELMDD